MKTLAKIEPIRAEGQILRYEARLRSVGNPDFGQDPSRPMSRSGVVQTATLKEMRDVVEKYRDSWGLGGGNWVDPVVYRDGKSIGYFSYNGRFWRREKRGLWLTRQRGIKRQID